MREYLISMFLDENIGLGKLAYSMVKNTFSQVLIIVATIWDISEFYFLSKGFLWDTDCHHPKKDRRGVNLTSHCGYLKNIFCISKL